MRAQLIEDGEEQIVMFPQGFVTLGDKVCIERDGDTVVLTPISAGDAAPGNEI